MAEPIEVWARDQRRAMGARACHSCWASPIIRSMRCIFAGMATTAAIFLFSYGTLQDKNVQLASFGRQLQGRPDAMPGFRQTLLEITDPEVLATSGRKYHPIVEESPERADQVAGTVFEITAQELAAADKYEVSDYKRVSVTLKSGLQAWVYVRA